MLRVSGFRFRVQTRNSKLFIQAQWIVSLSIVTDYSVKPSLKTQERDRTRSSHNIFFVFDLTN